MGHVEMGHVEMGHVYMKNVYMKNVYMGQWIMIRGTMFRWWCLHEGCSTKKILMSCKLFSRLWPKSTFNMILIRMAAVLISISFSRPPHRWYFLAPSLWQACLTRKGSWKTCFQIYEGLAYWSSIYPPTSQIPHLLLSQAHSCHPVWW